MIIPVLILLSACSFSKRASTDADGITKLYKTLGSAKLQVAVTANFPERVSKYRVSYDYKKDGESTITILEPKSVSDIKIKIAAGATTLQYDGVLLETGMLNKAGVTPLSVLPCLIKVWGAGVISETETVRRDGQQTLLLVYRNNVEDEKVEYRTWFDRTSYNPVYAETLLNGKCIIRCEFERTDKK